MKLANHQVRAVFMQTVRPWNDFRSGIVSVISENGNYIDKAKGGSLPYA
ncbi:hypothetical protein GUP99_000524 [Salmonella enterica]|nr:hypothetical protein [Salmonella enterica]EEJ6011135.1 hypothetical protein [Salmonella enterica subsp. enterica serovar Meleagridis]EGP4354572.1 hypothetical protein [Salmonella enterica]EGT3134410.1 hypothetical protein [Salmonella enterica subsp. enterica serovar Uganda]EHD2132387.1 hypothetical protein [Salmonella enterica]